MITFSFFGPNRNVLIRLRSLSSVISDLRFIADLLELRVTESLKQKVQTKKLTSQTEEKPHLTVIFLEENIYQWTLTGLDRSLTIYIRNNNKWSMIEDSFWSQWCPFIIAQIYSKMD